MTATELLNYYWKTWIEYLDDNCKSFKDRGFTFKEWVEADGDFQAEHLDEGEEVKFSEMYHKLVD